MGNYYYKSDNNKFAYAGTWNVGDYWMGNKKYTDKYIFCFQSEAEARHIRERKNHGFAIMSLDEFHKSSLEGGAPDYSQHDGWLPSRERGRT